MHVHGDKTACTVCELTALRDQLAEMTIPAYWRKQARIQGVHRPY
jgi:hypothetical protein